MSFLIPVSEILSYLIHIYKFGSKGGDQIGLLMTPMMITGGLLLLPAGWISDKIGRKIQIITYNFLASFLVLFIPLQSDRESLMFVVIAYGTVASLYGSLHAWPTDVAPSDKLGTAVDTYRSVSDLGFVVGPIAVTYFNDFSNPDLITFPPFWVLSIISIIAGIILVGAEDPIRSRES